MIGHSGSGKTTYMAGLFARMEGGVASYSISHAMNWSSGFSSVNERYKSQKENLERLATNLEKGVYPSGTDIHQEYNFYLKSTGEHSIPFDWYDYRGGALFEKTSFSKDVADLHNRIITADAMIVFLDGNVLVQNSEKNIRQYQRLVYIINKAIGERNMQEEEYFPISFVITKGDMHEDDNLFDCPGFNYFDNAIFSTIKNSTSVAALTTITEVNKDNIFNVHFPLLFSVYHGLDSYARRIVSDCEQRLRDRSIFADIGAALFGDDDKSAALAKLKSLDSNRSKIMEMLNENNGQSLIMF